MPVGVAEYVQRRFGALERALDPVVGRVYDLKGQLALRLPAGSGTAPSITALTRHFPSALP